MFLSLLFSVLGAFPVLSLMVGSVVTRLVPDEGPQVNITGFEGLNIDEKRAIVSASLTFLIGIFQVVITVNSLKRIIAQLFPIHRQRTYAIIIQLYA